MVWKEGAWSQKCLRLCPFLWLRMHLPILEQVDYFLVLRVSVNKYALFSRISVNIYFLLEGVLPHAKCLPRIWGPKLAGPHTESSFPELIMPTKKFFLLLLNSYTLHEVP